MKLSRSSPPTLFKLIFKVNATTTHHHPAPHAHTTCHHQSPAPPPSPGRRFAPSLCPTAERLSFFHVAHVHVTVVGTSSACAVAQWELSPLQRDKQRSAAQAGGRSRRGAVLSLRFPFAELPERQSRRRRHGKKTEKKPNCQAKAALIGREDQGTAARKPEPQTLVAEGPILAFCFCVF